MRRGAERVARIQDTLQDAGLDALVCTRPTNVLLLSGYWPVVGSAVAVAARDGHIAVLAPEDEQKLAEHSWASEVRTYHPSSLERLTSPAEAVREPLAALLRDMGVERGPIGYEDGDAYEPVPYAALYLYGGPLRRWWRGRLRTRNAPLPPVRSRGSARR